MPEIRIVKEKKELREFIHLPAVLHKDHANWVPPLYRDEWEYFDKRKNPAHEYCETILALCYANGRAVGRIMGIINHKYNREKNLKTARFSLFESIHDQEIADTLLTFAEEWAKEKGMVSIIGPYGMTYFDPEGLLTEGFEHTPTLSTNFNFEFTEELLLNSGYTTGEEFVVYKIDLPNKIPGIYYKIRDRILRNNIFTLVELTSQRELIKSAGQVIELINDCFRDIFGFSSFDKHEMDIIAKKYLSLLDYRYVKVVKKEAEMVGFIIAMPNISVGLRKSKGKLFPFGWLHILKSLRQSRQIDLLLGGVKQPWQGRGLDVMLGMSMIETAVRDGFTVMDSHHELVTNYKVRAEMEKMGGYPYKRFKVFQKNLID
jgi:GNAT superfamily N-acetyltransferase